jgi:hypothetical protein
MHLFAHYDEQGAIHSLVSYNAPEGVILMLTPEPGLFVGEVEDIDPNLDPADLEALRGIASSHKVDAPPRCKLLRKG